jgi:FKBP-type peptidyl-prolyl cis-trans isomerase SlyD
MSSVIRKNSVVTVSYTLLDPNANFLEQRTAQQPLEYIHGYEQIMPALERALEGQTAGYEASIRIEAGEAFGHYNSDLAVEMSRAQFPPGLDVNVGMKFNTLGPNGSPLIVRVLEVSEEKVWVDGNHPLAGINLVFEVRILEVRDATPEEQQRAESGPIEKSQLH